MPANLTTVVDAAYQAGFRGDDLVTAVAVAGAESSWNPEARNDANRNRTSDFGLWQINSIHNPDPDKWSDPYYNAQLAYRVFAERDNTFDPWVAYTNGNYQRHLADARTAVESYLGGQGGDVLARQATNRSAPVRAAAEQQARMAPGSLSPGDPFQARAEDPRKVFTAMLQAVSDRTAGRTGGNAALGLEATDGELDDGEGMLDLPDARTGREAIDLVESILGTYAKRIPPPAAGMPLLGETQDTAADAAVAELPENTDPEQLSRGMQLVESAKRFLGVDYVWGGVSATGMDCSGLMILAARQLGIDLPRVSRDQARAGYEVDGGVSNAQPGDLIAFDAGKERGVTNHIGLVVGRDSDGTLLMIHAPRTGRQVEIARVTRDDITAVRRIV